MKAPHAILLSFIVLLSASAAVQTKDTNRSDNKPSAEPKAISMPYHLLGLSGVVTINNLGIQRANDSLFATLT
jgi:hypothetical protein